MATPSVAFTPLQAGKLALAHRVALAPATRLRNHPDGTISHLAVDYFAQRASYPGTLLITDANVVHPRAGGFRVPLPAIYTPRHVEAWKKVVDAVHAKGSFLLMQLAPIGRGASAAALREIDPSFDVVGPSDVPFEGGDKPRPLTQAEIRDYIQWTADAARAFVEGAGGDGVEIHGANGNLIDQFLQTASNKRADKYGGSVGNRARFGLEVADAVAAAVGPQKVGFRLSPHADGQGMKMAQPDIDATFPFFVRQLKARQPDLAYLHLIEPRVAGWQGTTTSPRHVQGLPDITKEEVDEVDKAGLQVYARKYVEHYAHDYPAPNLPEDI